MPRQSRSRPAPRPAAPAPTAQQTRSAHTAAVPSTSARNPSVAPPVPSQAQAQAGGPGLLSQMAATAGSVAVGSTIGHGLSSMLFGGSSQAAAEAPPAPVQAQQPSAQASCKAQADDFLRCAQTSSDPSACEWFLTQLKACQVAAQPY